MKRNSIIKYFAFALVVFSIASCLDGNQLNMPPGGGGGSFVMMTYNTGINTANINSGISPTYFSNAAITFPVSDSKDSASFAVSLQGPTLSKDVNVTLKIDNSRLADNYSTDSLVYLPLPDSTYSFSSETGVIKAGKTYAQFQLNIYPNKLDVNENYMLPLTATNDSNLPIASNYQTIYLHTIGNPLAGVYDEEWLRWNSASNAGTPDFDTKYPGQLFAPVNPTTIQVQSAGTGITYIMSFLYNNVSGAFSNFKLSIDPASVTTAGITISVTPQIIVADPVAGNFEFQFGYINASGLDRVIVDKYKKK